MADSPFAAAPGAYVGLASLLRTRDGGLANAEAMVGWSGRLNAISPLRSVDADWGWDVGVHRMHYGEGTRYDFTEAMVGVLAPGWTARAWWAPHYFGGSRASLYGELNGSRAIGDGWRVFGHVGSLRYGATAGGGRHLPGRADALAGIGHAMGTWDVRLTRDGLLDGHAPADPDRGHRAGAWVLAASVAF